jgi:twitching motility protein PilT
MARIDAFLKLGLAQGCSDIHLAVGVPPMLRMNGTVCMPVRISISRMSVKKVADFASTSSAKPLDTAQSFGISRPTCHRSSN